MGYLALFVDDPSKLFKHKDAIAPATEDKPSILNESESMTEEDVRSSLIKFIEAFYYDQRRGYFDPPSYFANITETFYNYHNLTHQRLKEIYWKRMQGMADLRRNWIVSSLQFERENSRITATYWVKESYFKPLVNEDYSAQLKYELIINENGKIVSMRVVEQRNVETTKRFPDSASLLQAPLGGPETNQPVSGDNKIYDYSLVETKPEFTGGQKELAKYVGTNLRYPAAARQNNIQGKVYVSFIVEKDGQLTDVRIRQGIGGGCDEEAVRVLRASPKWKPGTISGSPVRTYYVLPITFQS